MRNINLFLFFVLLFINKRNDIEYHQKPHAETTKDPRFNVSPWLSCSENEMKSVFMTQKKKGM